MGHAIVGRTRHVLDLEGAGGGTMGQGRPGGAGRRGGEVEGGELFDSRSADREIGLLL